MTNTLPEIDKHDTHKKWSLEKNGTVCVVQENAQRLFAKDDWAEWLLNGNS